MCGKCGGFPCSPDCLAKAAKPNLELSLLVSGTGVAKDQEYFLKIYFIGFLFVYKQYLDKDIAFNWYLPPPATQIVPIMFLNKLGVGELLDSWVMSTLLILCALNCVRKVLGAGFVFKVQEQLGNVVRSSLVHSRKWWKFYQWYWDTFSDFFDSNFWKCMSG